MKRLWVVVLAVALVLVCQQAFAGPRGLTKISDSVYDFVNTWEQQPMIILGLTLDGAILSAADALSVARDISYRIKTLIEGFL